VGRGGCSGFWFLLYGRPLVVRNLDLRLWGVVQGQLCRWLRRYCCLEITYCRQFSPEPMEQKRPQEGGLPKAHPILLARLAQACGIPLVGRTDIASPVRGISPNSADRSAKNAKRSLHISRNLCKHLSIQHPSSSSSLPLLPYIPLSPIQYLTTQLPTVPSTSPDSIT